MSFSLPIRTRPSAALAPELEMAQQPSSPSTGSEDSLTQLPVRSHPAVRPVSMAKAKTNAQAKAKKNVSAARMLKKKGKVVKKAASVDTSVVPGKPTPRSKLVISRRIRGKWSSYPSSLYTLLSPPYSQRQGCPHRYHG